MYKKKTQKSPNCLHDANVSPNFQHNIQYHFKSLFTIKHYLCKALSVLFIKEEVERKSYGHTGNQYSWLRLCTDHHKKLLSFPCKSFLFTIKHYLSKALFVFFIKEEVERKSYGHTGNQYSWLRLCTDHHKKLLSFPCKSF